MALAYTLILCDDSRVYERTGPALAGGVLLSRL